MVFSLMLFPMEAKALTKEEFIYTNMDYYGNIYKSIVSNKNGSNFTVSNGKAIGTGSKNIIISIASSGIEESLDINAKDDLDKIIISYDTNSFKPTDIYLVVTPKLLTNVDYKVIDKLNIVSSNASVMQGSVTAIAKGAYDLQNNYLLINLGINDVNEKLTMFNEYTTKLVGGTSLLNKNIDLITKTLEDNLSKLNTSEYKDKINKLNTIIQTNDKTISNLLKKQEWIMKH